MTRQPNPLAPYKQRLYDAYVSSGQANLHAVGLASAAQLLASNRPYFARMIRPWLPADKAAAILDLGCSNGGYLYFIKLVEHQSRQATFDLLDRVYALHGSDGFIAKYASGRH